MSLRVKPEEMKAVFLEKLKAHGATDEAVAEECAEIMVENSVNGVYSHGVNRFPRMISYMDKGYIHPEQRPTLVQSFGAFEKWDGNLGMGNTNARIFMDRAIELAKANGIGCVALKNTNHWMRGGQYGLQAADAGCVGICWSNTQPNMPAWGGVDCRIGNNPFILCVPKEGGHLMMDGAMSQFSYGKLETTRLAGKKLPVIGGYDTNGNLTDDPGEIEKSQRLIPIGYWKGSGMSILLDMIVTILSDGNSVCEVGKLGGDEYALSQIFIAIDADRTTDRREVLLNAIIEDVKSSIPVSEKSSPRIPNERSNRVREENLEQGIPVDERVWETILAL